MPYIYTLHATTTATRYNTATVAVDNYIHNQQRRQRQRQRLRLQIHNTLYIGRNTTTRYNGNGCRMEVNNDTLYIGIRQRLRLLVAGIGCRSTTTRYIYIGIRQRLRLLYGGQHNTRYTYGNGCGCRMEVNTLHDMYTINEYGNQATSEYGNGCG